MKILVTGSGGYIGAITARALLKAGHEVVGIDSYVRGFKQPQDLLQKEFGEDFFRFYEADIRDSVSDILSKEHGIELAVHFAAFCNVGESEKDPYIYFNNNTGGVNQLMQDLNKAGIKKIVFSSTCAVFGHPQYTPIDEEHPIDECSSPYGESKLLAERIIKWYSKQCGMDYVILRYFNICGASDDSSFGDSKSPSFHLMQNAVRAALGIGQFKLNFTEVDTPDGSPIRDYINVEDLADAHVKAAQFMEKGGKNEHFNLGTGTGNSVFEIISMVEEVTNSKFEKTTSERRGGDARIAVADNSKARDLLGWKPTRNLEISVQSLHNWYKQRPNGWTY